MKVLSSPEELMPSETVHCAHCALSQKSKRRQDGSPDYNISAQAVELQPLADRNALCS